MKKISLLILVLTFSFSTFLTAQGGQHNEVDERLVEECTTHWSVIWVMGIPIPYSYETCEYVEQ